MAYESHQASNMHCWATSDAAKFFLSKGFTLKTNPHGVEINGRLVYCPTTYRWRDVRRARWYYSRGHEDFYERFDKELPHT